MQFAVVTLLALTATAYAGMNDTYSTTTVTLDKYTVVCPASSSITIGGSTYINTQTVESTITVPCPSGCAIAKPIYTTSSVYCPTCTAPSSAPAYPTNGTSSATAGVAAPSTATAQGGSVGTSSSSAGKPTSTTSGLTTAGAGKTFAVSGVGLAGLLGLAAYLL